MRRVPGASLFKNTFKEIMRHRPCCGISGADNSDIPPELYTKNFSPTHIVWVLTALLLVSPF
jgi:hypothetical protein